MLECPACFTALCLLLTQSLHKSSTCSISPKYHLNYCFYSLQNLRKTKKKTTGRGTVNVANYGHGAGKTSEGQGRTKSQIGRNELMFPLLLADSLCEFGFGQ